MSESHVKELISQRRRCANFAVLIDILASSFPKKRHDHRLFYSDTRQVCLVVSSERIDRTGASKRFGDARETAKRNCAHARRSSNCPVAGTISASLITQRWLKEPAGFQMRLARYGLANLAHKPGDPPKRSKKSVRKMLKP